MEGSQLNPRHLGAKAARPITPQGLPGALAIETEKPQTGDDVGARNNLKRWLNLRKPLDYEGVRRITARWQPYAGLVYFHMLLDRLEAAGQLTLPQNKEQ